MHGVTKCCILAPMKTKPIFVITLTMPIPQVEREDARKRLEGYHVIFLHDDKPKCQMFSIKETIELTDLKQLQDYLDNPIK